MAAISYCETFEAPNERRNLDTALREGLRSVSGRFSLQSRGRLKQLVGGDVFLTTSGSAALELALLVIGIRPGDEVILPSFTFTSVANAVVLGGGVPVFVDIDPVSLNLTAELVAPAITPRTRAIIVVHYAGAVAEMAPLMALARMHEVRVIEDAAHAIGAVAGGRPAGSFGDLAAFSFHYTKNVSCGEGGCLVVNDPDLLATTEIAFEKGTNRSAFINGLVDKYSWVAPGSSYTMSELNAAVLDAQLDALPTITAARRSQWQRYAEALAPLAAAGRFALPAPQDADGHNAHLFHLMLTGGGERATFIAFMQERGITTPFHYVPLHSAPAGMAYGRGVGPMAASDAAGSRLVRLPLYPALGDRIEAVIEAVHDWASHTQPRSEAG